MAGFVVIEEAGGELPTFPAGELDPEVLGDPFTLSLGNGFDATGGEGVGGGATAFIFVGLENNTVPAVNGADGAVITKFEISLVSNDTEGLAEAPLEVFGGAVSVLGGGFAALLFPFSVGGGVGVEEVGGGGADGGEATDIAGGPGGGVFAGGGDESELPPPKLLPPKLTVVLV